MNYWCQGSVNLIYLFFPYLASDSMCQRMLGWWDTSFHHHNTCPGLWIRQELELISLREKRRCVNSLPLFASGLGRLNKIKWQSSINLGILIQIVEQGADEGHMSAYCAGCTLLSMWKQMVLNPILYRSDPWYRSYECRWNKTTF